MQVTREFILKHSTTKHGSWTRSQIEALGIPYPPKTGWIRRAIGLRLSPEQVKRFENPIYSKSTERKERSFAVLEEETLLLLAQVRKRAEQGYVEECELLDALGIEFEINE